MKTKKFSFKDEEYGSFKDEDFEKIFKKEEDAFKQTVESKLIISLFGEVNSGKSMTINALTGRKLSKVTAIAGETTEVYPHPYSNEVLIVDTPGINDINEHVSKKASDFVERETDIIILFFNAAIGATKGMIDTYNNLKELNKPIILVLNKIDIWYDEDGFNNEEYYQVKNQIEDETGQNVIAISAKKEIGIKELNEEIVNLLKSNGKDILYTKVSKFKEKIVSNWINAASASSFAVGAIPLPFADMIPLTTIQVGLAFKIAYVYNCKVNKEDVMSLIGSTITGKIGKQLFKLGTQALKALGWIGGPLGAGALATLAGTIAASVTYGFGWACSTYYKSGMNIDLGQLGTIYKEAYNAYYNTQQEAAATK